LGADGKPHVPGSLDVWKNLFVNHPEGKYDSKLTKAANNWKDSDDVLEALFGLCRKVAENEPLKIFMALTDIDRNRARPMAPATADRLAREYRAMQAQYPLFGEGSMLNDTTIVQFLDTAKGLNGIRDNALRSDAVGTMQSLSGLWLVLTRTGAIPTARADAALS